MALAVNIVIANHDKEEELRRANRRGLGAKLYNGALNGIVEDVFQCNWINSTTPIGNNILHVHVGKPLEHVHKSKEVKETVKIDFIKDVVTLDAGYTLLWKQNTNGDTPLHLAARFGQAGAVEVFLKRAKVTSQEDVVRMLRITNKNKDTPLHEAARRMNHGIVKLLVEAADRNEFVPHQPNHAGETPLYLAAELGCAVTMMNILDYCKPSAVSLHHKGPSGRTALHAAAMCKTPATSGVIQKMLEIDSSLIRVQDNKGQTPLHLAAGWKSSSTVLLDVLLEYDNETNSAVYIQDNEGKTALHVATLHSNRQGTQTLLTRCPESMEIVDNKGQNVVHYAATLGCLKQLESVLTLGYVDKLVNDKDLDGNTPLHLLVNTVPEIPAHNCFFRLPDLISLYFIITSAFNNDNLTAGDVLAANLNFRRHSIPYLDWTQVIPLGRRIWVTITKVPVTVDDEFKKGVQEVKEKASNHLVIATLIATVSFTAGFTLPGGFIQDSGSKDNGMAVLTRNAAFKVFLIGDIVAFNCSAVAVVCFFVLAKKTNLVLVEILYRLGYLLTSFSLGSMAVAFLTGVYAVIYTIPILVVAVFLLSLIFFLPYLFLLNGNYNSTMYFLKRCVRWYPERIARISVLCLKKLCP